MTSYLPVSAKDFDFSEAPLYRQKQFLDADKVRIIPPEKGDEPAHMMCHEVVVRIGGEDRVEIVFPGDVILKDKKGNNAIISKLAWDFEQDPGDPGRYRSIHLVRAIQMTEAVEIKEISPDRIGGNKVGARGYLIQNARYPRIFSIMEERTFMNAYILDQPGRKTVQMPKACITGADIR
ncbi:MAG: hypothetical protein PHY92_00520 [Alphaproteobacteria bacterium]|nr:hypothetical protein [Alphaproteobacteria bacterium]